jgi:peptide/nickel transport system permease protein
VFKILLKKLIYILLVLLLISFISFISIYAAPNSFLGAGGLNPNMTPEAIEHLKEVYGLNKPLLEQYLGWLKSIITLDFGVSFASGNNVLDDIKSRLGVTLSINLISMAIVFFIALKFGVNSAIKGKKYDKAIKQLSLLSYATPSFYLALILIMIFGFKLGWFPITGLESMQPKEGFAHYLDMAYHLVLPISVIVFTSFGSLTLYIRSLTLDILKSDYIFFARARGIDEKTIKKVYIYKNLMPFIVTILGLSLPGLLGGSVILEQIFSIDGMGLLFFQAALSRDYPVIMGILIIGAFLTLLGNIIADLIIIKLDPYRNKR